MAELLTSEAILHRRSVKTFKTDPIPDDVLQKIIDLTMQAPSSWNFQPTRLVVLKDPAQKQALADVAWGQKQITQAPVVFVFAVSIRGWEENMNPIIQQAVDAGVWPEKMAEFLKDSAPGFQEALAKNGLEREYAIKDGMISATVAALAAEAEGLGTCYMNGWMEDGVKKIIGAEGNDDIAIALVLPVGYADVTPGNPGRLPQEKTVFVDKLS